MSDLTQIDYINASKMISGDILTQGPLPNTISDFWAMCWDSNASIIVNCTEPKDAYGSHCEKYWSKKSIPENVLGINIKKVQTEKIKISSDENAITIRTFTLSRGEEERQITQIHIRGGWITAPKTLIKS